jgi:hypothetical protein
MHPLPWLDNLVVFVATRSEEVPAACRRYASVDGSVPGATVTWDHHVTGEAINLDAMPAVIDAAELDGVGTTSPDTDALASVVGVLFGGKAGLPDRHRRALEAASYRCDHLRPHPTYGGDTDRLGRGLNAWVSARLAAERDPVARARVFASLCRKVAEAIAAGEDLPADTSSLHASVLAAERLDAEGRIRRLGRVAVVDLRDREPVAPEALYERVSCPVAVVVETHPAGGAKYTVGVDPCSAEAPATLARALAELATAEYRRGPPARAPEPVPGAENWGGRATVFGSPWNYGSRLEPDEVVAIVRRAGGG